MPNDLPACLVQGEASRLFPVLSQTSKEGRATSITLACISKIEALGHELLASAGAGIRARSKIETYTEVVFSKRSSDKKDRPDGLIIMRVGNREWRAIVESKIGNQQLSVEQVEKYREIAKENDIDCVITISNQFATSPTSHPIEEIRRSRSKIPVVHWSWMHIFTTIDLLINSNEVSNQDQLVLLNELRRFLGHESAGVQGFTRMPGEWTSLNKLVASGGVISPKMPEAVSVMEAWHQETRDLVLMLSRMTETQVTQKLSRKLLGDPAARIKDEIQVLCDQQQLLASFVITDAAGPIEVRVDLPRRTIEVGMSLRAPEDRKSTSARLNWLLRQIKSADDSDLYVRLFWPGRSAMTQHPVAELREDPSLASSGKENLAPSTFQILHSKSLGGRFAQQSNFISDLEEIVPNRASE